MNPQQEWRTKGQSHLMPLLSRLYKDYSPATRTKCTNNASQSTTEPANNVALLQVSDHK